jgi:hypothetical protein
MKSHRTIDADKIHILAIKTLEGNIECGNQADVKKVDGHQCSFELNRGIVGDEKMIGFKLKADIIAVDKKQNELSIKGSYTHEMIFFIENLNDFIERTDENELLDAALGSTLVGIMYSTVRGIIYSRTQGTSLGVVTLPVVAPLKLMGIELPEPDEEKKKDDDSKKEKKKVTQ